ncbi:recombinase family protein [Ursidibacter maritimus]|uniref:Recombinase family protein n=1 Tax=Ursidibacter maritimus TaxID=1331689 RepID=A0A949WF05_9PAST|nr:recombinase family protein [Ursidibacter maritimus]KAE9541376.1 hypothetical protein A1D26_00245 [Ursidibacter maritimus]MBV6524912.1 recombinase family protein [Ursidibacter maritimus]MBV6526475.1 recombinase family protein [Ursidibacter maritimus]MBV6527121.1 recombinase family protein [Ursidibacter maritimus]MBV6529044.1 recombinase family protein [Ursidibacter maritimus]
MLTARIYMRVSTDQQDLQRQEKLIEDTRTKGFYVAAVYREKISGVTEWEQRPELYRLIGDLQPNDIVVAESIDRLTRLEPKKALELIDAIRAKGAKIQVPEVFDFETISKDLGHSSENFDPGFLMSDLFIAMQNMFFKLAVSIAHDDYRKRKIRQHQGIELAKQQGRYRGRQPNVELHKSIIQHRKNGISITKTAKALNVSESTVQRVWRKFKDNQKY